MFDELCSDDEWTAERSRQRRIVGEVEQPVAIGKDRRVGVRQVPENPDGSKD